MNNQPKPGWKSTEFWMSYAASTLSFLYASGVLDGMGDDSPVMKGLALMSSVLLALGYTVSRSIVKKGQ